MADRSSFARVLFVLLLVASTLPVVDAPWALAAGIALGLTVGNPWPAATSRWSKRLLQMAVVGLGFGLGIDAVWDAARSAIPITLTGIVATVALGRWIGARLGAGRPITTLVSFGTAICGGSAIAAMAPVIGARDDETAVSLATVFTLNAIALLVFPPIGHLLGLDAADFGLWAALAIHDTSSVVGAAATYGGGALAIATTVKLARALWIVPSALLVAWRRRTDGAVRFPWFILGFVAAAALRSTVPALESTWDGAYAFARQGLVVTLFLIGAGLSRSLLRRVGPRPMLLGVILWIVVAAASLGAIRAGWIG